MMSEKKIVIVTLMRKDSNRLPGKNVRSLGGRPLYQWTEATARKFSNPYYVYHNFDSLALCNDVREVRYQGEGMTMDRLLDVDAEIYVMFPVTSPFRDATDVRTAIQCFVQSTAKVMVPVARCRPGTYYDKSRALINVDPYGPLGEFAEKRDVYRECGSVYAFRREQLHKDCFLSCSNSERMFYVDPVGIDINTEEDWEEAERWLRRT